MPEARTQLHRYRLGAFVLDERRGALQRDGEDVPLRPKSWEVLRYLVRHRGELVTKQVLLEAVWADRVVTEGVLAKSVGEVRLALSDDAHNIVRTVPRRGYVFDIPVVAEIVENEGQHVSGPCQHTAATAPVAEAATWPPVEDLPPGHRGASAAAREITSQPPRPPEARWGILAAVLLLIVAMVGSAVVRDVDSTPPAQVNRPAPPLERSIAVLPFADLSPERDQQFFADGMAEEILNLLSLSRDVTVIARTSSFAFRNDSVDAVTLGRLLNVAYLLEGSLRHDGEALRVAVQLVDARNGRRVWSSSFDRPVGETLDVQTEIARAVSGQLQVRLADPGRRRPVDPEAYRYYLEARFRFNRRIGDDLLQAEALYRKATRIDPDFARAWAGLAGVYWVRSEPYLDESIRLSVPQALAAMGPAVERALLLNPDLPEALIRGWIYYRRTGQPERARGKLARAQALAPNDPLVLASFGWSPEQPVSLQRRIELDRRMIAVDPLSLTSRYNFVNRLIQLRRLGEARRELDEARSLFPRATDHLAALTATIELLEGNGAAATVAAERVPDTNDGTHEKPALMVMAWAAQGLTDQAAQARAQLERRPGKWAALRMAEIHAHRGSEGEAFAWLREAWHRAEGDAFDYHWFWENINDSPFLYELKEDPRWRGLQTEYEARAKSLTRSMTSGMARKGIEPEV
jgi:TolB-like protein/DNA-binding winged helix-turn-helix (wHTH) protein/Tfp pilus assembly protein PilF